MPRSSASTCRPGPAKTRPHRRRTYPIRNRNSASALPGRYALRQATPVTCDTTPDLATVLLEANLYGARLFRRDLSAAEPLAAIARELAGSVGLPEQGA